jgi:hypothetical protein
MLTVSAGAEAEWALGLMIIGGASSSPSPRGLTSISLQAEASKVQRMARRIGSFFKVFIVLVFKVEIILCARVLVALYTPAEAGAEKGL